ncbi:MAG: RdgB/HAM1 family non-canonical purine NTP pyrophosphatase [Burkholderiaceae bacterium]|nr:RdgB/HAM1 family non-canonical purine NTP pyrophosphatase [Burkholderiales bacterium]MCZ8337349.1 RdgB/HAM1 family non-canonical purine NTP pyrophosphatase [Burkholderiaceae bacterium]
MAQPLSRVVLASGNAGKLSELQALLAPTGIELVAQRALGVSDADEPFGTFVENALVKARHASAVTGLPAIADDSGVCVPALGGAPGVRSARYAADLDGGPKDDAANNARLVRELAAHADRSAYYYCALVLVRSPDDPQPVIADGLWHGEIVAEPRGEGGFGYDPHFLVREHGLTVAQMDAEAKNRTSHRGIAMRALLAKLADARLLRAVTAA